MAGAKSWTLGNSLNFVMYRHVGVIEVNETMVMLDVLLVSLIEYHRKYNLQYSFTKIVNNHTQHYRYAVSHY